MLPQTIASDPRYAGRLESIATPKQIPSAWKGTPIEKLIRSENFDEKIVSGDTPELLIATCIEFRYALPIPRMFAYVSRRAGGRLMGSEFSLAYIFSQGVKHVCLVGHNDCGMTKVDENADQMINALVDQGWHRDRAVEFINLNASRYRIKDEIDALQAEYKRLMRLFRHISIAPLFVCLADTKLYIPKWYLEDDRCDQESAEVSDDEVLLLM